jgi:hypothetical protein
VSKWQNWTPSTRESKIDSTHKPTKPAKPNYVGFVGSTVQDFRRAAGSENTVQIKLPEYRCYACKGGLFWVSMHNAVICATCHPPASPSLISRWHWLPEIEGKTTQ